MVVLDVLAWLVVARGFLELAFGEAVGAGHAQVAEPGLAAGEAEEEVFRAPPDRSDGLAFEVFDEALGEGEAQVLAVEGDFVDAGAGQVGLETPADGFDFGQFGHGCFLLSLKAARLWAIPTRGLLLYRDG